MRENEWAEEADQLCDDQSGHRRHLSLQDGSLVILSEFTFSLCHK